MDEFVRFHVRKFRKSRFVRRGGEPAGEAGFVRRVQADRVAERESRRSERELDEQREQRQEQEKRQEQSRQSRQQKQQRAEAEAGRCIAREEREWLRVCSGMGTGCSLGSTANRTWLSFRNVIELEDTGCLSVSK